MVTSFNQSIDNAPECQKTLVNHARFPCPFVFCSGAADVLRASKIDKIKLSDLD
jgi:hypothetical protein